VVTLSWDAHPGAVSGYRLYYGTSSRTYAQAFGSGAYSATNSYTVSGLPSGWTYYFAVTAVNASAESAYSNEVTKTVP
jgi:fibronectin type 3 domain-containing protein